MTKKDAKGESREGTGWVAIYRETGITHCYTLECNYHNGRRINHIPHKTNLLSKRQEPDTGVQDSTNKVYSSGSSPPFTAEILEDSGRALGVALLDIINDNPVSRIVNSTYKSVENVRSDIKRMLSNKIKVWRGRGVTEQPVKRSNTQNNVGGGIKSRIKSKHLHGLHSANDMKKRDEGKWKPPIMNQRERS